MATTASPPVVIGIVPVFRRIWSVALTCYVLALFTDVAYWQTGNLMWQNFSAWLLLVGAVASGVGMLVGLIELVARRAIRLHRGSWSYFALGLVALVLAVVNNLVHAGDGWTAVVPYGLALSLLTVVVMLAGNVLGNRRTAALSYKVSQA